MSTPDPSPATPEEAQLRADLDHLRSDVADTVAELAERVDVPARAKAQARETVADVKAQARETVAEVKVKTRESATAARQFVADTSPAVTAAVRERPVPVAGIVGAVVVVLIVLLSRRRR